VPHDPPVMSAPIEVTVTQVEPSSAKPARRTYRRSYGQSREREYNPRYR
jgi:hypothetical protein